MGHIQIGFSWKVMITIGMEMEGKWHYMRDHNTTSVLYTSGLLDKLFQYFTINNHNIYYTVYFYIQEIHGGGGLISRIEYLTYIVEFETIHTEDLPSDWIIRLTIIE